MCEKFGVNNNTINGGYQPESAIKFSDGLHNFKVFLKEMGKKSTRRFQLDVIQCLTLKTPYNQQLHKSLSSNSVMFWLIKQTSLQERPITQTQALPKEKHYYINVT